jgi:hypothetical protein
MKPFLVYPRAQTATNARDFSDAPDPINPEFPTCAYPSPKSIRRSPSFLGPVQIAKAPFRWHRGSFRPFRLCRSVI